MKHRLELPWRASWKRWKFSWAWKDGLNLNRWRERAREPLAVPHSLWCPCNPSLPSTGRSASAPGERSAGRQAGAEGLAGGTEDAGTELLTLILPVGCLDMTPEAQTTIGEKQVGLHQT